MTTPHSANAKMPIVWLDDDLYLNDAKISVLRDMGLEIMRFGDVDSALEYVLNHKVALVITDIMLPNGAAFDSVESQGGFETGWLFAQRIRKLKPHIKLIAHSVASKPEIQDWFVNQRNCWWAAKPDYDAFGFSDLVSAVLDGKPVQQGTTFKSLVDAIDLKPGAFGISVDLKKLWRSFVRAIRRRK